LPRIFVAPLALVALLLGCASSTDASSPAKHGAAASATRFPLSEEAYSARLEQLLIDAGPRRAELERALHEVPPEQRAAQAWLIERMPPRDLAELSADYLIENCELAHAALAAAPWRAQISEAMFRDAVLPYASINERRDRWRADFHARFAPLVRAAKSTSEAAALLNNAIFAELGVRYSTQRKKSDQSPYESIESGLASCSGLSILLIDACRAVGLPARFVGTPMWSDGSGNHSWVEIWDGRWRFTGAAEPTGMELDQGWFTGRAATARAGDAQHAIYAVTWDDAPLHFPLPWLPNDRSVRAHDVTERYLARAPSVPEGMARVRFRARSGTQRQAVALALRDELGKPAFEGLTKDESADGNDHLTFVLPLGASYTLELEGKRVHTLTIERDEQLVELELGPTHATPASATPTDSSSLGAPLDSLRAALATSGLRGLESHEIAHTPLTAAQARQAGELLWQGRRAELQLERRAELDAGVIELDGKRLRFTTKRFGTPPPTGPSLWISLHGGGGAPPEVNDKQWQNQQRLYELEEGIYVAPRAPTDTWNLWHEAHVDPLLSRLIENFIALEGVDANRVYLLGYSAGGDGVYQLAPRLADRFAGAAMMAGHPNETRPDGLAALPFALHMGALDSAYQRNTVAADWQRQLDALAAEHPGSYPHQVVLHADKGHWMDRLDAAALPWLAAHARNTSPRHLVWLQDDVTHERLHWLATRSPKPGTRIQARVTGQRIELTTTGEPTDIRLLLGDSLLDLDQPVEVRLDGKLAHSAKLDRTIATLLDSLASRADPHLLASTELALPAQH